MDQLSSFKEIWFVDFEFQQPSGDHPTPACLVGREWRTGRLIRMWQHELESQTHPPYSIGDDSLFVAYYASAEFGCHLALDWPMPCRILDLFAEFRCLTSGKTVPCGNGLLGALAYFGLDAMEGAEKTAMRDLAIRGGPYTSEERDALLDYCQSDVDALAKLLPKMLPLIDLPRALLRGRYMAAAAHMEWNGIPIDVPTLARIRSRWDNIQTQLIEKIDRNFGVYEGRTFKANKWADWLAEKGIPWPRLSSGALALDSDTFKQMGRSYPEIIPLKELRSSLSQLRLNELAVGKDGRNRCMLSAFRSRTGRNQPSNSKFAFGPSAWLRGLIKPCEGTTLAYIDYEQQEFGIAAALSGDVAMKEAYESGDPYLAFAKQAGARRLMRPNKATNKSVKDIRCAHWPCNMVWGLSHWR